jgi:hypothetical protein
VAALLLDECVARDAFALGERFVMKRFLAGLVLVACSACSGGSNSGSSTAPSSPPLVPTSDMFTGTVPVGGSDVHPFVVTLSNGQVTADLTAAGPPPTIAMGLGIGAMSNGVCSLFSNLSVVASPGSSPQTGGNNVPTGTYCVAVFDVGNQLVDVSYSVTVTHY